jgi:hypothetical protein
MTMTFLGLSSGPCNFDAVTPSDATLLKGVILLKVTAAGNLVLKGVRPGAVARSYPYDVGDIIPFESGYVMAATTASVDAWSSI